MRVVYFNSQEAAESVQHRIFTALQEQNKVSPATVRYSDVIEHEGRYYIYVLDEHLDYLTDEERASARNIEEVFR